MNIQTLLANTLVFLNDTLVPFLMAIAFLVFLWNAARYFIIEGSSEEGQTKAKSLALWGILAFVVMVSIWGVVNLIVVDLGFETTNSIIPDYMCEKMPGMDCIDDPTRPTGNSNRTDGVNFDPNLQPT